MDKPWRVKKMVGPCSVEGCTNKPIAQQLCKPHYHRQTAGRSLAEPLRISPGTIEICVVDGCNNPHKAKGYCIFHWRRKKNNVPLEQPKAIKSKPALKYEDIQWRVAPNGYVVGSYKGKRYSQHRFVWEQHHGRALHPFENIHHINGIRHDNRIENLELWTKAQPAGQRAEDLVAWVVENYPDMIAKQMKGKINDQPASPRRPRSGDGNNKRATSRPDASRRTSSRTVRSR
jgi:hypothetical protein